MNHGSHQRNIVGKGNQGLYWTVGGMLGGVIVGITLANIYGWTVLSATFWLGVGLLAGALSGGLSFMIYRAMYGFVRRGRQ